MEPFVALCQSQATLGLKRSHIVVGEAEIVPNEAEDEQQVRRTA